MRMARGRCGCRRRISCCLISERQSVAEKPHRNGIQIDDDRWIDFISLDGRRDQAVNIDQHIKGLLPLFDMLEMRCVAECCGFDAFDFTRSAIIEASQYLDPAKLHYACTQGATAIEHIESTVVLSTRMNNLADKQVMIRLLNHISQCVINDTN